MRSRRSKPTAEDRLAQIRAELGVIDARYAGGSLDKTGEDADCPRASRCRLAASRVASTSVEKVAGHEGVDRPSQKQDESHPEDEVEDVLSVHG